MKKHLSSLGDRMMPTLDLTPKTSSGSHPDADHKVNRGPLSQMPMLSFVEIDEDYDPEDRAKNIPMCPAPMTSRGDHSIQGFSMENNIFQMINSMRTQLQPTRTKPQLQSQHQQSTITRTRSTQPNPKLPPQNCQDVMKFSICPYYFKSF